MRETIKAATLFLYLALSFHNLTPEKMSTKEKIITNVIAYLLLFILLGFLVVRCDRCVAGEPSADKEKTEIDTIGYKIVSTTSAPPNEEWQSAKLSTVNVDDSISVNRMLEKLEYRKLSGEYHQYYLYRGNAPAFQPIVKTSEELVKIRRKAKEDAFGVVHYLVNGEQFAEEIE